MFALPKGGIRSSQHRLKASRPGISAKAPPCHDIRSALGLSGCSYSWLPPRPGYLSTLTTSRAGGSLRLASSLRTPEKDPLASFWRNAPPDDQTSHPCSHLASYGARRRQNQWVPDRTRPPSTHPPGPPAPPASPIYATTASARLPAPTASFAFLSRAKTSLPPQQLSFLTISGARPEPAGMPKSVAHLKLRDCVPAWLRREEAHRQLRTAEREAPEYRMNVRAGTPAPIATLPDVTPLPAWTCTGSIMNRAADTVVTLAACEYVTNPELAKKKKGGE